MKYDGDRLIFFFLFKKVKLYIDHVVFEKPKNKGKYISKRKCDTIAQVYNYAATQLCNRKVIELHRCALLQRITTQLHHQQKYQFHKYTTAHQDSCTTTNLNSQITTQLQSYKGTLLHSYTTTQLHNYTTTQLHNYTIS